MVVYYRLVITYQTKITISAVIESVTSNLGKYKNKTMVFMAGRVDSFDANKAKMMIIDDFLDIYSQDKELMKKMLQKAKKINAKRS